MEDEKKHSEKICLFLLDINYHLSPIYSLFKCFHQPVDDFFAFLDWSLFASSLIHPPYSVPEYELVHRYSFLAG